MVRNADRQALRERAVHACVAHALDEERLGPRVNVFRLQVLRDVEAVRRPGAGPDAGQVRLAVSRPRRGRREIGLAVGQPRDSGRGIVEPLRDDRRGQKEGRENDRHRTRREFMRMRNSKARDYIPRGCSHPVSRFPSRRSATSPVLPGQVGHGHSNREHRQGELPLRGERVEDGGERDAAGNEQRDEQGPKETE